MSACGLRAGQRSTSRRTTQFYLQGRAHILRFSGEGYRQAIVCFEQAIARDATYAAPYTGIAQAYSELAETGEMPPEEAYPKAQAAARRAIELDPDLADAHAMMAYVKMTYEFDWAGAEREFQRAIELNPNSADTYDLYGRLCGSLERYDEGIALQTRANELDPIVNKTDVATAYLRAGRHGEAIEYATRAVAVDTSDPRARFTLGWALLGNGQRDAGLREMERALETAGDNTLWLGQLGEAYGLSGETDKAAQILARLIERSRSGYVSPYHLAYVYTGLGKFDEAIEQLERAYERRSGAIYGIKGSFLFKPLRNHARFVALLRKMHLA